ncbi:MAG: putative lipid II flippase FtsW [Rickettsiales bacterium]
MSTRQGEIKQLRNRRGMFRTWWNTIDKVSMSLILLIIASSLVMVTTASPAVATRIGLEPFYFMKRQIVFLILGTFCLISLSFTSVKTARRIALIGFLVCLFLMVIVLIAGADIKGAKRWISLGGFSLQPSEFAKPFFSVVTAWVLSIKYADPRFPSFKVSFASYIMFIALLLLQPDFGMTVTATVIWIGQLFIAGLSFFWVFTSFIFGVIGVVSAYLALPHVQKRIDSFLNPETFDNYQVQKSIEAFKNGGFYGTGPGEGTIKYHLPDSHTDFIFAVIGEEMGVVACLVIIFIYAVIVIRGLYLITHNYDQFNILAVSGILIQIGVQSVFNIGVTLHLFPTKGMTLPLISYGGSSVIATAIALGLMLSFTRKRYNVITLPKRYLRDRF